MRGLLPAFCLPAWRCGKRWHRHRRTAVIQLQELTLGFWRFLLEGIPGLAVVELPCRDAKFRQSCFIGDVVLLAVGYNLRNFFACRHKKNVFREGKPEVSGFNDGCHRRLTIVRSGCENTSFAQVAPSESILSISVDILARLYYIISLPLISSLSFIGLSKFLVSTTRHRVISASASTLGFALFVHRFDTVAGSFPIFSARHLLVCFFSTKTTLILFKSPFVFVLNFL